MNKRKDRRLTNIDEEQENEAAAEDKIDSMPLLLFGDYDIVIEKN